MENDDIRKYLLNILKNSSDLVENKIKVNNKYFNKRKDFFYFKKYVDEFLSNDTDNRFFIMPGLRGVGKTTIIFQLYDYLVNDCGVNKRHVLYLDLDRLKDWGVIDLQRYFDVFIKDINEMDYLNNEPLFLFVDESQHVSNWALVGKIIYDETKNVFMIFTGSDALNLGFNKDSARRSLKKEVYSLSFSEYLNLKYSCSIPSSFEGKFCEMLFSGCVGDVVGLEEDIQFNTFINLKRDVQREWEDYVQYGGLPFTLNRDKGGIVQLTLDMKDRIIEKDMDIINSFTSSTRKASYSLLNIIALQSPSDISQNKLAKDLEISKKTVSSLLSTFEKTQVIFHVEPYGSIKKRVRKSWEYYFLSTQIKACIYLSSGQATRNKGEYFGYLLENLVASSLFKMRQKFRNDFGIFYDSRRGGVDFLINTVGGDVIPIEVGIGKKNKKQVKSAMDYYNSDFAFVVSNKTDRIVKNGDVIFVPPITFSLI